MKGITRVGHMVASAARAVFVIVLAAAVISMLTGGPFRVSISPSLHVIATSLRTEHALPRGTELKIGDAKDPVVLSYDKKGRVVLSPPREKTFADVLKDGVKEIGSLGTRKDASVASRDPTDDGSEW